ncbi:MAG: CPBP family intramembrane metalloprotease [Lachnospiraceae bacterium]|nr:CPBP family intramembrane metalloprotease [Lachnospiraceae bacterium]
MRNPGKKMNGLFLAMLLSYLLVSAAFALLALRNIGGGVIVALIAGELAVVLPGLVFLLLFRCDLSEWIPLKAVRFSTIAFSVLLTVLLQPLLYFLNIISQFFIKNVAADLFAQTEGIPGPVLVLSIAIIGPLCEEISFRGILLSGFRRTGRYFAAVLWTAFLFGLFHMNLNQFGYAMMIGFFCALTVEATGSMIPALIIHIGTNGYNVLQALALQEISKLSGEDLASAVEQSGMITPDFLLKIAAVMLIPAVGGTILAFVVLIAMAKREGRKEHLLKILPFIGRRPDMSGEKSEENAEEYPEKGYLPEEEQKSSVISATGIIGVLICVFMIFFFERMLQMLGL